MYVKKTMTIPKELEKDVEKYLIGNLSTFLLKLS
jgi:hypothetical protein